MQPTVLVEGDFEYREKNKPSVFELCVTVSTRHLLEARVRSKFTDTRKSLREKNTSE